jgi:hypothetical protein
MIQDNREDVGRVTGRSDRSRHRRRGRGSSGSSRG